MPVLILFAVVVCFALCFAWVKFVYWIFVRIEKKPDAPIKEERQNPYIKYQLFKEQNDKDYEEYMEWMKDRGVGVPVKKLQAREDREVDEEIKNLFR